jgi:hypothetical protein
MKMKYITALLILVAPLFLMGQKGENTLLPEADVLFHKDKIIYLISFDTPLPLVPVTYPQAYQMEYLHTGMPGSVDFDDQQSMIQYLGQISLTDVTHDDLLLFLRAAALYKIWVGIGYVSETVDLKPELQQLSENASSEISNLALKVMEIK